VAFVLNDRVKETTTTTGTGTINLAGAATGFETFVAGIGNSNVTYYCIAGQGTAEFEVGIGTVTDASPDTLSRTTILSSSNSDSAVNFSAGTKDVFCTLPASKTIRELDTALNVPTGTTAQRASSPAAGDLRFNTTSSKFEGYSGSAWGNVGEGNFLVTNIFAGDGSDTTFTISNAVSGEQQLMVFIDGVFQAHDTYTVSGTTVTFSTAPANGRVITIYSALNNVQGSNMVLATMTGDNSDTTLALGVTPTSENAVQVYIDGTYQNKDTYSISGQTLTFSTAPPTGTAVEAITHTITDISAAASNILVDEFTGDGSDTTFTLSAAPTNENNTQVFVGGVYQEKATYSISNAVLTFTAAPANGVSIEVVSIAVGQINSAVQLSDADGDTKVMVEESSDEDKIRFDTGGTERMLLDDNGKLIIGDSASHVDDLLQIETPASGGGHGIQIRRNDSNTDQGIGRVLFGNNTDTDLATVSAKTDGATDSGALQFSTQATGGSSSERMRINSTGFVGIGESNPSQAKLHITHNVSPTNGGVNDFSSGSNMNLVIENTASASYPRVLYKSASSSVAVVTNFEASKNVYWGEPSDSRTYYFRGGAVNISGALSKGSGSFKIDHPLESKKDTHHLVHSFVEGPQADNIYRGKVDLVAGSATINIDTEAGMTEGTFVALNTDVQCFTSNESNWDAVKGSVSGNVLTIESQNSESTATVSWMVIGERQDQHMLDTNWTDEHGKVILEPLKDTEEIV
jgi:hypothetical protein